ncbi:MAG: ferredoxin [Polyangiaceae bacterium]|nr:ferredoxin [Polyangiaceae bacterium]
MKIKVDWDRCEGNAVCVRVAREAFRVDESDMMHVLVERPEGELLERVKVAVARCPRHALSLVDDDADAG